MLRTRILRFFENTWRTRKLFDEAAMLRELPPNLRTDIAMHICADLVDKVPLFKVVNPVVAMMLVPLMQPVSLMPGELVYRENEIADVMYFISSGEIQIESAAGVVFTTLGAGSYFGEFSFLYDASHTRTAHARAVEVTELFALSREGFNHVTRVYPELMMFMKQIADARTAVFKAKAAAAERSSKKSDGIASQRGTMASIDGSSSNAVEEDESEAVMANEDGPPLSPADSQGDPEAKQAEAELMNEDFIRALDSSTAKPQDGLRNLAAAAAAGRRWKKATMKIAAVANFAKPSKRQVQPEPETADDDGAPEAPPPGPDADVVSAGPPASAQLQPDSDIASASLPATTPAEEGSATTPKPLLPGELDAKPNASEDGALQPQRESFKSEGAEPSEDYVSEISAVASERVERPADAKVGLSPV